ncbi:DUF2334 domain-containing protein [Methanocaldococcus indicus]|uniref:DUF2334 domain-containing protein n=1 Tax=Methanocaldococcus indicus TaxID=213231 RepID=UPI003C6D941F
MKTKLLFFVLIVFFAFVILTLGSSQYNKTDYLYDYIYGYIQNNTTNKSFVILVHDVSPKYYQDLKDIVKIIDNHNFQDRTYLFVIVNHANEYNLEKYSKFVKYLHELEKEGYHIEYHGYNHIGKEFNCNKETAEEKLKKSLKIFKDCGFNPKNIDYFIPPRYALSKEAENVFINDNFTIIVGNKIITKYNNTIIEIPITNKEYTWYLPKNMVDIKLKEAINDYNKTKNLFCLSIHPRAVNYGGGLELLDKFLTYVQKS